MSQTTFEMAHQIIVIIVVICEKISEKYDAQKKAKQQSTTCAGKLPLFNQIIDVISLLETLNVAQPFRSTEYLAIARINDQARIV